MNPNLETLKIEVLSSQRMLGQTRRTLVLNVQGKNLILDQICF